MQIESSESGEKHVPSRDDRTATEHRTRARPREQLGVGFGQARAAADQVKTFALSTTAGRENGSLHEHDENLAKNPMLEKLFVDASRWRTEFKAASAAGDAKSSPLDARGSGGTRGCPTSGRNAFPASGPVAQFVMPKLPFGQAMLTFARQLFGQLRRTAAQGVHLGLAAWRSIWLSASLVRSCSWAARAVHVVPLAPQSEWSTRRVAAQVPGFRQRKRPRLASRPGPSALPVECFTSSSFGRQTAATPHGQRVAQADLRQSRARKRRNRWVR